MPRATKAKNPSKPTRKANLIEEGMKKRGTVSKRAASKPTGGKKNGGGRKRSARRT